MNSEEEEAKIVNWYSKVDEQAAQWYDFWGDMDTPAEVEDWNKVYAINQYRFIHVHDSTGKCIKNRVGHNCN